MTTHRHHRTCPQPGFARTTTHASPTGWAVARCEGCGVVELRRQAGPMEVARRREPIEVANDGGAR